MFALSLRLWVISWMTEFALAMEAASFCEERAKDKADSAAARTNLDRRKKVNARQRHKKQT